ncbi:MAG: 3-phosphoshikimate 1-carboxyvinyltransferase, partial [Gammaproteobacteria bacterium]|nr:3-phosphoshikimate 1-carboxyvinyltransferase [Gammaproteobacteria bacterium]
MPRYVVEAGGFLRGELRPPGDKSISHRAVMLSALADGHSAIDGFLNGGDCLRTLAAFEAMGVAVKRRGPTELTVRGVGIDGLRAPLQPLDLGNSGTSMRLLAGLLAGQKFASTLTGDESLSRRPMRRIVDPLRRMGARIDTSGEGTAP